MIRSSTVATLLSYHTGPRPLSDALRRCVVNTNILTKVVITNFLMIIMIMIIMIMIIMIMTIMML